MAAVSGGWLCVVRALAGSNLPSSPQAENPKSHALNLELCVRRPKTPQTRPSLDLAIRSGFIVCRRQEVAIRPNKVKARV